MKVRAVASVAMCRGVTAQERVAMEECGVQTKRAPGFCLRCVSGE